MSSNASQRKQQTRFGLKKLKLNSDLISTRRATHHDMPGAILTPPPLPPEKEESSQLENKADSRSRFSLDVNMSSRVREYRNSVSIFNRIEEHELMAKPNILRFSMK